jgi:hypothetical protein
MNEQTQRGKDPRNIRVLHYLQSYSENQHVGHCLDLDLVATGPDQETAALRLDALVKAQMEWAVRSGDPALLDNPAPMEYWERFLKGVKLPSRQIEFQGDAARLNVAFTKIGILPATDHALAA